MSLFRSFRRGTVEKACCGCRGYQRDCDNPENRIERRHPGAWNCLADPAADENGWHQDRPQDTLRRGARFDFSAAERQD